ncbi:sugar porter family MFS transporter [Kribbella capetownensis]|uniref:Sugar porter family MFS transporter n=1 Tax=Kribbella capetownensis TaxID=1572659 RepID=A0A4R0K6I0_9ACTN|nr:sugar porter family MFS transporter [Kribbella capetownensis]TCC53488.1 sugar porter family MFS transporter [Kribbella capetownensis]
MPTGIPATPTADTPLAEFSHQALRKVGRFGLVIAIGSFLFGYDTGVVSGALLFIKEDFSLNAFEQGAVVSVLLFGAIVGAPLVGRVADRLGRKKTLCLVALVFAAGIAIAALAGSYPMLLIGRVIMGLGVGGVSALVPTYLSEISPAQIRGRVLTLNQLLITVGLLVSYLVDLAFASSENWRAMFAVGLIPAVGLALGSLWLPESPAWLMNHGKVEQTRSLIASVAGDDAANQTIDRYKREGKEREHAEAEQTSDRKGARVLTAPRLRAAVVVGLTLAVLQQFAGINTIVYYAPTIMQKSGLSASNSILYSVIIGVINLVTTIISLRLVDRVGRRPLLLVSLTGMLVSLVGLGFAFVAGWPPVLILVFILLYIVAFAIGMGPVFWVLLGEIFPRQDRAAGVGAGSTVNWTANLVVSLAFLPLVSAIGQGQTFWLFAIVCAIGVWFVARYVPETKDRDFIAIDADLQARWKHDAAHA